MIAEKRYLLVARGKGGIYDIGLAVTVTQQANDADDTAIVRDLFANEISASHGVGIVVIERRVVRHDNDRGRNHQLLDVPEDIEAAAAL